MKCPGNGQRNQSFYVEFLTVLLDEINCFGMTSNDLLERQINIWEVPQFHTPGHSVWFRGESLPMPISDEVKPYLTI